MGKIDNKFNAKFEHVQSITMCAANSVFLFSLN